MNQLTLRKLRHSLRMRVARLFSSFGDGSHALPPSEIKLYINETCNGHCLMCDIGQKKVDSVFYRQLTGTGSGLMSPKLMEKLLEDIQPFSPRISFAGVEPLLHPGLAGLVRQVKARGLEARLVTNGNQLPELADSIMAAGVDEIIVSIDGWGPLNDRIRGKGAFELAIGGLRNCVKYRNSFPGTNCRLLTHFCITGWNVSGMMEYAERMLLEEKVDRILFSHPYFVTERAAAEHNRIMGRLGTVTPMHEGGLRLEEIDTEELWGGINELQARFPRSRLHFNIDFSDRTMLETYYKRTEQPIPGHQCRIPWQTSTVLANGDVIIHNRCFSYVAGNIERDKFGSIWNGPAYRRFRRKLKQSDYLFPACVRCCGIV